MHTRVLDSGVLDVDQWVRTRTPIRTVTLRADPILGTGGPPVATFVKVAADGNVVEGPGAVGIEPQVVDLGGPTRLVHVSYLLTGVVVREEPGTGDQVAVMTSLAVDHRGRNGTLRESVSGDVQQLHCWPRSASVAAARALRAPAGRRLAGVADRAPAGHAGRRAARAGVTGPRGRQSRGRSGASTNSVNLRCRSRASHSPLVSSRQLDSSTAKISSIAAASSSSISSTLIS